MKIIRRLNVSAPNTQGLYFMVLAALMKKNPDSLSPSIPNNLITIIAWLLFHTLEYSSALLQNLDNEWNFSIF